MDRRKALVVVAGIFSLIGLGAAAAALLATQLGLDSNPDWGPSRKLLFGLGVSVALLAWTPVVWDGLWATVAHSRLTKTAGVWSGKASQLVFHNRAASRLASSVAALANALSRILHSVPIIRELLATPQRTALTISLMVWGVAVIAYAWVGSVGTLTRWPPTTSDFDLLAEAFVHGQANLPVEPSPQLLALSDPYGMESRQYMPSIWDVSYFKGKFYLYWGPVPALLLAGVKLAAGLRVDDGLLTLIFTAGASLMAILSLVELWKRRSDRLPWWVVVPPSIALAGATPVVWLLSRGAVYEVAIASGQFFFLAGLLAAVPALFGEPLPPVRLAISSALLALAIGCRVNLAPACALILAMAVIVTLVSKRSMRARSSATLLAAGLPMAAALGLLGAYNLARFGSLLEFGHRYQLGRWDKFHDYGAVFGLRNVIPNLYNYILNGIHTLTVFPYLKPAWGQYYIWPTHTYAPPQYHTEKIAGILIGIPFLWFAAVALLGLARRIWRGRPPLHPRRWLSGVASSDTNVSLWLALAGACLFAPLATFVAVSMRHEVDFVPTVGLLAAVGFWNGYAAAQEHPARRRLLATVAMGLAIVSAIVALLLAMTGFQGNFETYNPILFSHLTSLLSK
jgi:hypothetical protein